MELFREFKVKVDFGSNASMGEKEAKLYQIAKEQFLRRLKKGKQKLNKGKGLVLNIFKEVDQLTRQYLKNNTIACRAGCPWCCLQLVCCTTLEMQLIISHLKSLPRKQRKKIREKVAQIAKNFYDKNSVILGGHGRWEEVGEFLRQAHHGLPCVFLADNKNCSIYPVRPIDCRSARAKMQCGPQTEEVDLGSVKFYFDQIASDLIMQEEEKRFGQLQVVPLIGWPLTENFYNFFFR